MRNRAGVYAGDELLWRGVHQLGDGSQQLWRMRDRVSVGTVRGGDVRADVVRLGTSVPVWHPVLRECVH